MLCLLGSALSELVGIIRCVQPPGRKAGDHRGKYVTLIELGKAASAEGASSALACNVKRCVTSRASHQRNPATSPTRALAATRRRGSEGDERRRTGCRTGPGASLKGRALI